MPKQSKQVKQKTVDPVDAEFSKKKMLALIAGVFAVMTPLLAAALVFLKIGGDNVQAVFILLSTSASAAGLFLAISFLEEAYAFKLYMRLSGLVRQSPPTPQVGAVQPQAPVAQAYQPKATRPVQVQEAQLSSPILRPPQVVRAQAPPVTRQPRAVVPASVPIAAAQPRAVELQATPPVAQADVKRCPKCGRELPYGDLHIICPFCGTPLK
ncbi:MAG: hypothetical protein B7L53_07365 [Thermofilum sp. NZ13]|nr:MAG: hypothetical protein B7L53_07365 [Thermofilum sp. NZ13]